jgi:hypothetical protein
MRRARFLVFHLGCGFDCDWMDEGDDVIAGMMATGANG